jgi:hypothetical protein
VNEPALTAVSTMSIEWPPANAEVANVIAAAAVIKVLRSIL